MKKHSGQESDYWLLKSKFIRPLSKNTGQVKALNLQQNELTGGTTFAHEIGHLFNFKIDASLLKTALNPEDVIHAYGQGTMYYIMSSYNNRVNKDFESLSRRKVNNQEYNYLNGNKPFKADKFYHPGGRTTGTMDFGFSPTNNLKEIDPANKEHKKDGIRTSLYR